MKKNKLLMSCTMLALPLLMANSPAPFAYPDKYDDAEVSYVKTGETDNENLYEITIENNGSGYVNIRHSSFDNLHIEDDYYYDYELVAPNKTMTFSASISKNKQINESNFAVYAYTEFGEKTHAISDISSFEKTFIGREDENHNRTYLYTYRVTFTSTKLLDVDYNESVIYCVNYGGSDHYYYDYSVYSSFEFSTKEDLNAEDITLKPDNTIYLKGREYNSFFNINLDALAIVGVIFTLTFVFPVIPGLVVAIVFLIRGIVKKNKNKKDSVKNK